MRKVFIAAGWLATASVTTIAPGILPGWNQWSGWVRHLPNNSPCT